MTSNTTPDRLEKASVHDAQDSLLPLMLGVGQGTVVRLNAIEDAQGRAARKGASLTLDYDFVKRGKATRYQVRKTLHRLVVSVLVKSIVEQTDSTHWKKRRDRDQRWLNKHVIFHPRPSA